MGSSNSDTLDRYRSELLADVIDRAQTDGDEAFLIGAFTDLVLEFLEENGEWPDYQVAHFSTTGAAVDGWGHSGIQSTLFIAVADFNRVSDSKTLSRTEADKRFKRLATFVDRARRNTLTLPDHSPVNDLVDLIQQGDFDKVELHLLTERVIGDSSFDNEEIDSVLFVRRVWDIETIRRARTSNERLAPIDVDFSSTERKGLRFLDGGEQSGVQSYLLFIPATVLATVYQEHGGRILERNVRAFLSARGKVNRGIRDTLREEPERFLAYNNGLTATAAAVQLGRDEDGHPIITSVTDLQIVNGGQTTASIAASVKEPETSIDNVQVQTKLAVIDECLLDEMVPNISKFANRQNAVNESDLSSNHEYLVGLQESSRAEWTPLGESGRPTKWYFERARGAFDVDLAASGTPSNQKRFLGEYPKSQKFNKNDIAVYENTWACLPYLVARGGQKNFVEFMLRLPEPPKRASEESLQAWNRARFRDLVGKAIAFKAADNAIRIHYGGTYKRVVVTYTIAYILNSRQSIISPEVFWSSQCASLEFVDAVVKVAGPAIPGNPSWFREEWAVECTKDRGRTDAWPLMATLCRLRSG